jgi:hypothetical protein
MAQLNVTPPNLPLAPIDSADRFYLDQLNNVLRLFFNQLTNPGPVGATSLNFDINRLPTQADFADLRSGDVYYDTSGGTATSYPLRIKA